MDFPTTLLSRVEDAGLNASAPPEQRVIDGWLVRFNGGKARRARCANALAAGRLPLAERLELVQALYREHGLPPLVRITPFSAPADLDQRLAALGWTAFEHTQVMVCDTLQDVRAEAFDGDGMLEPVDAATYAAIVGGLRDSPPAHRTAHAQRLQQSPVRYRGFVLRDAGGAVLACAQFAAEGELVGLYDVFTDPRVRGRGLARRLCATLLARAHEAGATAAYLQVGGENTAARAVYRRLGFVDAYTYHYRAPPGLDTASL